METNKDVAASTCLIKKRPDRNIKHDKTRTKPKYTVNIIKYVKLDNDSDKINEDGIFTKNNIKKLAKKIQEKKANSEMENENITTVELSFDKSEKNLPPSTDELDCIDDCQEVLNNIKSRLELIKQSDGINEIYSEFEKETEKLACAALALQNSKQIETFHEEIIEILKILDQFLNTGITAVYSPEINTNSYVIICMAANACLIALYLLVSSNLFKHSSNIPEITIQKIVDFTKNQIRSTILPECTANVQNYVDKHKENKKNTTPAPLNTHVLKVYKKICEITHLLSKILEKTLLNNYCILSLFFTSFTVFKCTNVSDLQIFCLQIAVKIYSRQSNDSETTQMFIKELLSADASQIRGEFYTSDRSKLHLYTALVLHLIQSSCYIKIQQKSFTTENFENIIQKIVEKEQTMTTFTRQFLTELLSSNFSKQNGNNFKLIIKEFMEDLILLLEKPEWPAARFVLNELCLILLDDKDIGDKIKGICVVYVGQIVGKIKSWIRELKENDTFKSIIESLEKNDVEANENKVYQLQKYILSYLEHHSKIDDVHLLAYYFNTVIWVKIISSKTITEKTLLKNKKHKSTNTNEQLLAIHNMINRMINIQSKTVYSNKNKKVVEIKMAILLCQCVSLNVELFEICDKCLLIIRNGMESESKIEIAKSLKAATLIVENFPNIFTLSEIHKIIQCHACGTSAMVKEAAINLLGKYLSGNPEKTNEFQKFFYETMTCEETSVRKRTVEIFGSINDDNDFYLMLAKYHEDVKISRMILEIFEKKWFLSQNESLDSMVYVFKKANSWQLKQLKKIFVKLYNKKHNQAVEIYKLKMITNVMENIVNMFSVDPEKSYPYFVILYMIAKANVKLISEFVEEIQNMITFDKISNDKVNVQMFIMKTIKQIIPVIDKESILISQLEFKLVRALGFLDCPLIKITVSCLSKLITITENYSLIFKCFCINYNIVKKINQRNEKTDMERIKRALLIVGVFIQIFDLEDSHFTKYSQILINVNIVEEVFQFLLTILRDNYNNEIEVNVIETLGLICVKYEDCFFNKEFETTCKNILKSQNNKILKFEVLKIFKCYFQRQAKMQEKNAASIAISLKNQDIKEMNDDMSKKPSILSQTYLKYILRSIINTNTNIRQIAIELVKEIDAQGFVNPIEIVPFLICMTTDSNEEISDIARSKLEEVRTKYPEFIISKSIFGIRLSFKLRKIKTEYVARGITSSGKQMRSIAVNDFLYTLIDPSKRQRRGLILNILKEFENEKNDLEYYVFLADNLSAFSYKTVDDILFVLYYINELLIQYGATTFRQIKKILNCNYKQKEKNEQIQLQENDFKNKTVLLNLLPNTDNLKNFILKIRIYSLLQCLWNYLQKQYGINELEAREYLPSVPSKTNETVVSTGSCNDFKPGTVLEVIVGGCDEELKEDEKVRECFLKEFFSFHHSLRKHEGDEDEDDD